MGGPSRSIRRDPARYAGRVFFCIRTWTPVLCRCGVKGRTDVERGEMESPSYFLGMRRTVPRRSLVHDTDYQDRSSDSLLDWYGWPRDAFRRCPPMQV
jgi:hypothetical protein